MSIDLTTKAGVLRFAELRQNEMRADYLRNGELEDNPTGFVFATHRLGDFDVKAGKTTVGAKLPAVQALPIPAPHDLLDLYLPNDHGAQKDFYAFAVKMFAEATRAIGVLLIMDAWALDDEAARVFNEQREIVRAAGGPWLEVKDQPKRHECLWVTLEHKAAGVVWWKARIERSPLRIGAFERRDGTGGDSSGRFTNFIPVKN